MSMRSWAWLWVLAGCEVSPVPGDVVAIPDPGPGEVAADPGDVRQRPLEDSGPSGSGIEAPATELLVRITAPAGNGWTTTLSSVVSLSGVVFGPVASMQWEMGDQSGPIEVPSGTPFWLAGGISLKAGDNRIRVRATDADGNTVSDALVITRNTSFMLPNPLEASPPALFVGSSRPVLATLALGPFGVLTGKTLRLHQVDADGKSLNLLGEMSDDGKLAESGDEIQGDGVFTLRVTLTCSAPGALYLRAVVPAQGGDAWSAPVRFECLPRLGPDTCQAHRKTLVDAREAFLAARTIGKGVGDARKTALALLRADSQVMQAAGDEETGGIWVRFQDGVLGALNLPYEGDRGGEGPPGAIAASGLTARVPIRSRDTLLLSPFADELGSDDETVAVASLAAKTPCPVYNVSSYNGSAASLERFRGLTRAGLAVIATHGEVYFQSLEPAVKEGLGWHHQGLAEVIWTGETVNCGNLAAEDRTCASRADCPQGQVCILTDPPADKDQPSTGICHDPTQVDVMAGRIVLGDRTWGILPAFLDHHLANRRFPDSLVHLGGCRTLYNGSLAASLFAAGASAVTGFTGSVTSAFAARAAGAFFERLMTEGRDAGGAYGLGTQDPDHPGSWFRLFGARGLWVSDSAILNESFEFGDLTAWGQSGDGRVITRLGGATPVQGKFMGIISTGLGYTVSTGAVDQHFCLQPGARTLSFFWKYYSEEFQEFCGTRYQDTFKAELWTGDRKHEIVNLAVDDLCPPIPDKCPACGSKAVGLKRADINFDVGDTFMTDWQKAELDVSHLVGNEPVPVTLRFYCTDKGDSIYDTAVLVDGVSFR